MTASAIVSTLDALGVALPSTLRAAKALSREELGMAGWKTTVAAVDEALRRTDLSISENLRFKYALDMAGLLV